MHSHSPKVEIKGLAVKVLILVVMEDALAPYYYRSYMFDYQ